ncbi:MAG TPA: tetratricopeptide repeat protein [Usitatibacteraceae bacterium]|nr:tetratricopeptide repeat protein [Usitatibacteraceae bacterium]
MNAIVASLALLLLAACASAPLEIRREDLFRDSAFGPPVRTLSRAEIFSLSPVMKSYLEQDISREARVKGRIHGLIDTLYTPGQLRLDYDSTYTRTAREAFDSRSGNCLSLVIMTAAFAREMGLPVRFHNVWTEETWTRSGGVLFASGHVNLTMGSINSSTRTRIGEAAPLTVDFVRPDPNFLQRSWEIGEQTIAAMFMNNRAAEGLARGNLAEAYWWVRAAIDEDPRFFAAHNTLGVIYRRQGNLEQAERVLRYVLAREPGNLNAMSNLAIVLEGAGRTAESVQLAREVERLRPFPPFHFFDLGMGAMRDKDYPKARDLFLKEVERAAYNPDFHFWLGAAYVGLGDLKRAQQHLAMAVENSTTGRDHAIYAAKLDWIRHQESPRNAR